MIWIHDREVERKDGKKKILGLSKGEEERTFLNRDKKYIN